MLNTLRYADGIKAAVRAGVPVVPGTERPLAETASDEEIGKTAAAVGYPLLVKAVAGGGGFCLPRHDRYASNASFTTS